MDTERYGIGTLVDVGNDAFRDGKQAGIKEVVEFLENDLELYWRSISKAKHDYYIPLSLADTWQAKLKEWGLATPKDKE